MRVLLLVVALAGCTSLPSPPTSDLPVFELLAEPFIDGRPIPVRHTCDGEDIAPSLHWSGQPESSHYALLMQDIDAGGFVHWLWWDVPAGFTATANGFNPASAGGVVGQNDFGDVGYAGPCPEEGKHRYYIHLYALASPLGLPADADRGAFEDAIAQHAIAQGVVMGTRQR